MGSDAALPPFPFSSSFPALRAKVGAFMRERVIPSEPLYDEQHAALVAGGRRWAVPPVVEELKAAAKAEGLWNLFLPNSENFRHAHALSNLDYAPLAEMMGAVPWASEVFNCNAPDTGNMEVLARYGTRAQQAKWLAPLLEGRIRSAFCMTEPAVASSDATNMQLTARRKPGGGYTLQGTK